MTQLFFIKWADNSHVRIAYKPMGKLFIRKEAKGLPLLICLFGLCITVWI